MAAKPTCQELEQKVDALSKELARCKGSELALRESEDMFLKAFRSSPAAKVITRLADGTIIKINESFTRSTGYSEETSLGRTSIDMGFWTMPEDRRKVIEKLKKRGSFRDLELRFRNKAGKIRLGLVSCELITINGEQCIITAIEDITARKQTEEALKKAVEELERRVEERTLELQIKTVELQEVNSALRILIRRRDTDKKDFEKKVLSNVKELVQPHINKLKKSRLNENQMMYLKILESNLSDIVSPFVHQLSSRYAVLTPTEIQVAQLVKEGMTTKEIAEVMGSSKRTVESHRDKIRVRLGLKNKKTNLRSYLSTI